jgi:cbb3-type cytochrome oxidase maturation protein
MNQVLVLLPVALFLGFAGLMAFLWSLRSGQYEDLDGAMQRVLSDDEEAQEMREGAKLPRA